jgi:hypothetical protein
LPQADAAHLADLLCAADVAVTTSSTLSIDAACADTPIVNVFFDGTRQVAPAVSTARFMHYTHYAKLLETGGIAPARTFEEFILAMNRYLADRTIDAAGRREIIRQQLTLLDGQAGRRTADSLLRIMRPDNSDANPCHHSEKGTSASARTTGAPVDAVAHGVAQVHQAN